MLADLDLLLIAVFCTADDLLPAAAKNARRRITDAEVVTLCVAQAVIGIASDREFLAVAAKRLGHLCPDARSGRAGPGGGDGTHWQLRRRQTGPRDAVAPLSRPPGLAARAGTLGRAFGRGPTGRMHPMRARRSSTFVDGKK